MNECIPLPGQSGAPAELSRAAEWKDAGKVLVVDDEDAVRGLVAHSVQRLGYVAKMASAGPEAVAAFESDPASFCLVILDLRLPGIDGIEVLLRLRAIRSEIPAILMSGYTRSEPTMALMSSAPTRYLTKPFTFGTLSSEIRSILKP